MTAPVITPIAEPPKRGDGKADFAAKADAFAAALPQFVTEANTSAAFVDQRAIDADASAQAAAASEAAAEADRAEVATNAATVATNTATVVARADEVAANTLQVASNTQQVATDAQAVANALASIADGPVVSIAGQSGVVTLEQLRAGGVATQAGAETLTNKTLSAATFTDGYTEETFAPAAGSTFTVDLANGTIQGLTTNANATVTLPAPAAGKGFQLQINYGGAHTLTWAVTGGSTIGWPGGKTPAATSAAGKTDVFNFISNAAGTQWLGSTFGAGY